jgi:D-glycero-D-manno-heptose 1,7-bisphosphate phosphatase
VSGRPAAFLDRDGVLNELVIDAGSGGAPESPLRVEDVRLLPGASDAIGRLTRAGFAPVCVSNQPAAAKGRVSVENLLAVHRRVLDLLEADGVRLEFSRLCLHHPQGVVAGLAGLCSCRKPEPGMLLDAARTVNVDLDRSWMVGDTDADVRAGQAAGCRTVSIAYPGSVHKRSGTVEPDILAASLSEAVTQLLERHAAPAGR